MACTRDYDFHPPDEVRLFPMPTSGVRRLDDEAFVAEVRYGDITVRHDAFRDQWFKVNCTTDPAGAFVDTTSPDEVPPFTFNCDIATPMLRQDEAVFAGAGRSRKPLCGFAVPRFRIPPPPPRHT